MKFTALFFSVLLTAFASFIFQGCGKCEVAGEVIEFKEDQQFFSVQYLDSAGNNYLTNGWNTANVSVLFNGNAGYGQYTPFNEDLSDSTFGPFPYTVSPAPAYKGEFYDYYFVIRKDTHGTDTFRVTFYPAVDECTEYWGNIEYYRNGLKVDACSMQETCTLTFIE